ncbi:MAG: T9SS type A sorting domain-containing protein [Bacteroidetes bacterium]|nr:T9SS type A sorting domain-containing protein [Bacteroidota bacterium]
MKKPLNSMLNKCALAVFALLGIQQANAQCSTTNISGDYTVNADIILSGTYNISGTFKIPANVTVYVKPFSSGGCGKLEINAQKIIIIGAINGDYSGNTGGSGGLGGSAVTSLTGDNTAINTCSNKDNTGVVMVEGGKFGSNGSGPGAGVQGQNGTTGSGPKQQCLNSSDECGMIGGSGGAGGGGGGSYGGAGSAGSNGGNGTNTYTATGVNVSTGYIVVGGSGGTGGSTGVVYGTASGNDIDLGSGGAGAGGGGCSYNVGLPGGKGGNGGGLVKLIATDSIKISGKITSNGENGTNGGDGGNGGISPKCCSDGCDDAGEETLSCGAGGGSGSGGGSGGGIYIQSQNAAVISGTLQTTGGNGGNGGLKGNGTSDTYSGGIFCGTENLTSGNGNAGTKGGAGGGGRIKIFVPSCLSATVNPVYSISGGTGNASGSNGTYQLVCGFTGIENNIKEQNTLILFPNPFQDKISVRFKYDPSVNDMSRFSISNTLGEVVKTESSDELRNQGQCTLDLSDLQPGIYFIQITLNQLHYDYKIIKQ